MSQSASTTYSQSTIFIDHNKWKQLLFSPQLPVKIEQFRKWHKNPQTVSLAIQAFHDKEYFFLYPVFQTRTSFGPDPLLLLLRQIVVFYCNSNSINYQQGLLQIAVPFVLLKSSQCKSRQCYGYFDSFMHLYFPALLTQKLIYHKKQLPMASFSIHLASILLNYIFPELFYHLKSNQIPLSMVFTQELLTVFAKNLQVELIYGVFENFMIRCNQLQTPKLNRINQANCSLIVLILLSVSLLALKEEQIIQKEEQQIHMFLFKSLKTFKSTTQLIHWFELYDSIIDKVPQQFFSYCQRSLNINSQLSLEPTKLQIGQRIKTQQSYQLMIGKEKQTFSYLIEVKIKQIQQKQIFCVALRNTKVLKKTFRSRQIFCLEKFINPQIDTSKALQNLKDLIGAKKVNQQFEVLIVIVIQAESLGENERVVINFAQKFIQGVQTKLQLRCMKIYLQNDLIKSSQGKKAICSLI